MAIALKRATYTTQYLLAMLIISYASLAHLSPALSDVQYPFVHFHGTYTHCCVYLININECIKLLEVSLWLSHTNELLCDADMAVEERGGHGWF